MSAELCSLSKSSSGLSGPVRAHPVEVRCTGAGQPARESDLRISRHPPHVSEARESDAAPALEVVDVEAVVSESGAPCDGEPPAVPGEDGASAGGVLDIEGRDSSPAIDPHMLRPSLRVRQVCQSAGRRYGECCATLESADSLQRRHRGTCDLPAAHVEGGGEQRRGIAVEQVSAGHVACTSPDATQHPPWAAIQRENFDLLPRRRGDGEDHRPPAREGVRIPCGGTPRERYRAGSPPRVARRRRTRGRGRWE